MKMKDDNYFPVEVYEAADSILRAAGSKLSYYTLHKTRDAILTATELAIRKGLK